MLSPPALWLLAVCLGFVCFVKRCIFNPFQLVAVGGIHCITSILAVLGASPPGAALLCIGPAGSCAYTLPMLPAVTVSSYGGTKTALIKRGLCAFYQWDNSNCQGAFLHLLPVTAWSASRYAATVRRQTHDRLCYILRYTFCNVYLRSSGVSPACDLF